jgi:hypothetical protein
LCIRRVGVEQMSDDDLGYARKEDEDRTLYLRRTGFGRAGRDILSSRAVDAAGGAADPLRASSDREERGGLIAPRYGAQGAPPQTLQTLQRAHQKDARSPPFGGGGGFLDDSMDDLDEQNFGDSFASPPRDRGGRDRGGDSSGGGKQADEQQQPAVVKMVKKAVLPPPKMPPPRGARPSAAVAAVRNQLSRAPPGKPAPGGRGGGAAAQYRARLLAKQRAAAAAAAQRGGGKSSDEGKAADRRQAPPAASLPSSSSSSSSSTGSSKFDDAAIGSATQNFRNELRRVVQNDAPPKAKRGAGRSSGSAAVPHPFGGVADSSDEEDEDSWKRKQKEKALLNVFSHEWEMQSPDKKDPSGPGATAAAGPTEPKVNRPRGSLHGAMASQASYDMGEGSGPSFAIVDDGNDDDRRKRDRYDDEDDDAGDRGDDYDDRDDSRGYDSRDDSRDGYGSRDDDSRDGRRRYSDDDEDSYRSDRDYSPRRDRSKEDQRDRDYDDYDRRDDDDDRRRDNNTPKRAARGEGKVDDKRDNKTDEEASKTGDVPGQQQQGAAGAAGAAPSASGGADATAGARAGAGASSKTSDAPSVDGMGTQDVSGADEAPPGEIRVYDARKVPRDRAALLDWVLNPPANGEEQMVQAFVERDKSGALGRFYPLFRFYIEVPGEKPRLIMYSRKLKGTRYPNFLISLDEFDMGKARSDRGAGYIGKMQGSGNNQFTMFDHGANPTGSDGMSREARQEMCVIAYASKNGTSRRATQDRRMEVAIPAIIARPDGQEHSVCWRPRNKEDGMREWFRRIRMKGSQNVISRERLLCLHNRMWSHGKTSQLDEFMNRAQETSSKNFQLVVSPPEDPYLRAKYDASPLGTINTDDVANVLVQMGRCSDRFNIDFQYPVSAFAAFGICLTRFCGIGQT